MSFIMKIMISLDIVSLATIIVSLIILEILDDATVHFSKTEKFFEIVLTVVVFVFIGSLIATCLTWIWGW